MGVPKYLKHLTVLEFAGLAPGPLCGQMLADYGARVIRIDRPPAGPGLGSLGSGMFQDQLTRSKKSIAIDLKHKQGQQMLRDMLSNKSSNPNKPVVDVLIDVFRPGVLERLNVLPSAADRMGKPLIVARITGYGQKGRPYWNYPGHDVNYVATSGAVDLTGPPGTAPAIPATVLGDLAGMALAAFSGITTALLGTRLNKDEGPQRGIIMVDVNAVDSLKYMTQFLSYKKYGTYAPPQQAGQYPELGFNEEDVHTSWDQPRGANMLEGVVTPFYGIFATKDADRYMSVGALEPKFFAALVELLDLTYHPLFRDPVRLDRANWPEMHQIVTDKFKQKGIEYWTARGHEFPDACVMPVEALVKPDDVPPAVVADFLESGEVAPQPREQLPGGYLLEAGAHTDEVLQEFLGQDWETKYGGSGEDKPPAVQWKGKI